MEDLLPPSIPKPSYDLISDSSGGIYDIATDNYEPPGNVQGPDRSIKDDGIDELLRDSSAASDSGGVLSTHPFQVVQTGDDKVQVRYGTVNGEVPEIGIVPLNPVLEDGPELAITGTGTRYVYLEVDIDISGNTFQMDSLKILESWTIPESTTTKARKTLNTVTMEDAVIKSIGTAQTKTALNYAYGGSVNHFFVPA